MKCNLHILAEMKLLHCTSSFFFYVPDPARWAWDGGRWLVSGWVFRKKFLIFFPKIGIYLLQNSLLREIINSYVIVLVRDSPAGKT